MSRLNSQSETLTRIYEYFPKLCFPTCGLEINQRRSKMNPNLTILTMAEVTDIKGEKVKKPLEGIIESAYDHGANMIVTPCPICQMNVEVYQDDINATYGTKFNMPVIYYSTLISVAYGRSAKDAALDAQIIPATKLDELAGN